jgi:hypothetical protein
VLNFDQPIAVMFLGVLGHVATEVGKAEPIDAFGAVARKP